MNERKLSKLKGQIASMRLSPQKARDIEALAQQLGRKLAKRGKEPVWISMCFQLYPLAIPHHGGKDLATGTRKAILNHLEADVLAWEEKLAGEEDGEEESE